MIYVVGSLRNPEIPRIAQEIRDHVQDDHWVFDDWYAAGPEADDYWKAYSEAKGQDFPTALADSAAQNVFKFDKRHLEAADIVVLVLPAGRSGHMELGWSLGKGKRGYILLDSPDRWDVMYNFADGVFYSVEELLEVL